MLLDVPDLLAQLCQGVCRLFIDIALVHYDPLFDGPGGMAELYGDEPLASAVLQVLEDALIARVVRDDQKETVAGLQNLPLLLDGQETPVVGQRVDKDSSVLAGLHHLIEVAD